MSKPRLPTHAGDTWECSFLFESTRVVRDVSCRGGMVMAAGDEMFLLRPGAQHVVSRVPPLDIGPIHAVAAEQRAPWRFAVASEGMVSVFYKNKQVDQILRLRCSPPGPSATHLAWGRHGNASTLYVRWDDGAILRVNPDMSGGDPLDLPPMDAIAADHAGVLAMISFDPASERVYVTKDGSELLYRPLPDGLGFDPERRLYLACADQAVAFAIADGGAFVSRDHAAPFERCEPLESAGPLEFETSSSDASLFGGANSPSGCSILRVDKDGEAIRIADFGSEGGEPPALVGLGWDATRRVVWGASHQMGLVTCTAPSAKRSKKLLLS